VESTWQDSRTDQLPDQPPLPQRETGAPWWAWTLSVLGPLLYFLLVGSISPDGARSCILLFLLAWYLSRSNQTGPRLTKRMLTPPSTPFPPHPGGRTRTRRRRYPRHYYLRRKISRRNPVLLVTMELIPWDLDETKAHMKHRWISNPRATYGTHFDIFCKSLDPLPHQTATDDLDGNFTPPDRERYRQMPGDSTKERRAADKHKWVSDPQESYGLSFDDFCTSFDPTAPLSLMKGDFVATTKVKERFRTTIRDFAAPTKATTCQD
jgi:hypothetical protein